ncbi:MAG: hypothetical protein LUD07_06950 [Clostridiales bacterium]|nr:hypothetical protein [Clostridiales bacterium]
MNVLSETLTDGEWYEDDGSDLDDLKICSATDCTGLIPALPQTETEYGNYEEIYPFLTKPAPEKPNKVS